MLFIDRAAHTVIDLNRWVIFCQSGDNQHAERIVQELQGAARSIRVNVANPLKM